MRLYFLIALFFVLPILIVSSFLVYNHFRKSTIENASYLEFRISQAVSKENKEAALKDISSAKVEPRTFRALINSYKLVLNKSEDPSSTLEDISDSELRSIYLERKAYYLFSQGKPKEALDVLNSIRRDSFNYQSSLLLKAQVLVALGDKQTATKTLEEIIKTKPDSYLANIAKLMLQEL